MINQIVSVSLSVKQQSASKRVKARQVFVINTLPFCFSQFFVSLLAIPRNSLFIMDDKRYLKYFEKKSLKYWS
jgi:hypothetical protein